MTITPRLFEAFLKCPTKSWLRFTGEPPTGNPYADWVQSETESYRADAARRLIANAPETECAIAPASTNLKTAQWRFAVDIELRSSRGNEAQTSSPEINQSLLTSAATVESHLHAVERIPSEGRGKAAQFVPIRFISRNKLTTDDKLLLAFDALVLFQVLRREVSLGKIIHGDDHATLKVKTSALAGEVRKRLGKIAALLSNPAPPDLVLNRHCAECEFQARCRKIAIEKDDLSLLANMSAKERQKLRSKGIFTVTQLSYTFRPRRRPKRLRDKREKYHHSLKALAIREQKIHIVGSPELKIEGTPVYLDVEGLPDRDFYYLIGLRIGSGDSAVQHSLWADTVADEGKIWREFLAIIESVEKPVLIHYGSYETTFSKRMSERHGSPQTESVASKAIASALNLVSVMFARIYFPTYSNGLKEIARYLGFEWSESNPSGPQAICWRSNWEQCRASTARENLITYNEQDCKALDVLAAQLATMGQESATQLDVDHIDKAKTPVTERGKELSRSLCRVLKSAHEGYETRKISLHSEIGKAKTDTTGLKPLKRSPRRRLPARSVRIIRVPRKRVCQRQRHAKHPTALQTLLRETRKDMEHTLLDLKFTRAGCKKIAVRYIGRWAYCSHCHGMYPPPAIKRMRGQFFGHGFHVWAIYLRVVLRLSIGLIAKMTRDFFHVEFPMATLGECIERTSAVYADTERTLLREILKSPSIHIDETKLSIHGTPQFVWVLTDGRHVAFRLTPGRETGFLQDILKGYEGTIVTDFYGGYDALPCRQQKCLVHLIRDLNDDLWKNLFDEEYEQFVATVRELIVPILVDVQNFGLKTYHLRKHKKRVDRFYKGTIENRPSDRELTAKYQKRFVRYQDSLFKFLEYDGVAWNNNAAERAIRHLAVQRKISGAFSTNGANSYLRLLAIAQTCRFQEKSFLGFLLSGLKSVDAYKYKRRTRGLPREE